MYNYYQYAYWSYNHYLFQAGGGGAAPAPGVEIPSGAFVAKITNDAREEEMEENMEQVSEYLLFSVKSICLLCASIDT